MSRSTGPRCSIQKLTEQLKPAKGQAWDSFEHRAADALVGLCEQPDTADETPTLATRPVVHVHVPEHGPAEIAGVPIADSLLEQLRANASIESVLVDDAGVPLCIGTRTPAISPKTVRAVLLRDGGRCRCTATCDVTWGLQVHHLPEVLGWDRRPVESDHRGPRPPPRTHPPRPLGTGRQTQPPRRDRPHPHRRPHNGTTRTARTPATTRRTDGRVNGIGVDAVADALELEVVGRLAGGEHGAVAVSDADGTHWALKVFGFDEERKLASAIAVAATLRSRGVPVPAPYRVGTAAGREYTLKRRCPGELPGPLTAAHARQLWGSGPCTSAQCPTAAGGRKPSSVR
jgi:hypothetical protein